MTDAALADRLKATLRGLPGPVALVTTVDPVGAAPQGMLASAVIPVSMDPPSMLVAINRSASMHPTLAAAGRFCINVLGTSQADVLALFSKPGYDLNEIANGLTPKEKAELHVFEGMAHGFWFGVHMPESREAIDLMARFFERHLAI